MSEFFELIGMGTVLCLIILVIYGGYHFVKEEIERLKWEYKYKHRFDKPPTAKCYCRDCKYHGSETNPNRCRRFGETTKGYRCTADNWFCWEAEPLEKDKED